MNEGIRLDLTSLEGLIKKYCEKLPEKFRA
jgi:hypothetical protein